MRRVTHINASRHTYKCDTWYACNEPYHTHECVVSPTWISHVPHMKGVFPHTHDWVRAHTCIGRVTCSTSLRVLSSVQGRRERVYVRVFACVFINVCVCACVCMNVSMCAYTYIHASVLHISFVYVCMRVCVYEGMCVWGYVWVMFVCYMWGRVCVRGLSVWSRVCMG